MLSSAEKYIFNFSTLLQGKDVLILIPHLEAIVGPAAKLHITVLVVEGEPGDVYLAGGLEDAGRDVGAAAAVRHHHVGRVRPVKLLVSAKHCNFKLKQFRRNALSMWQSCLKRCLNGELVNGH